MIQTNHITRDVWFIPHKEGDLEFIALAHNEFGKILAVLAEAEALAAYDDYEGPRMAIWDDFRKAISALKGGTE